MEAIETVEKPLSDAESFEEFKALRHPKAERTAAPAVSTEKTPQAEEATSETAAASETAEPTTTQEKPEPKTETAEDRIKALRSQGKHAAANKLMVEEAARAERERGEAEIKKLREEMEALRRQQSAAPAATQQQIPEPPKPAVSAPSDPNDPEPNISDERYQKENGFVEYQRDVARWIFRQEAKQQAQQQAQQSFRQKGQKIMSDGAAAHPDFDAVVQRAQINRQVLHDGINGIDNFGEVLYVLGSNPAELARIQRLSPPDQWFEVRLLSRDLAAKAAAPVSPPAAPEPTPTLRPAVTRAAPPPRVLTGAHSGEDEPVKLSDAQSFEDFKRIRHRRRA